MDIRIVELPEIAVIGKQGLCTREKNMAAQLWEEANACFAEVAELGMREQDGSYVGFWGAMSDEAMRFQPWEDDYSRGLYLAGVEVYADTPAPEGWTKWILSARRYLVAELPEGCYGAVFGKVIREEIPARGLRLAGAVCDYTKPSTGQNMLFFPVEKL